MEFDKTLNKWFEEIKQKVTGGKTYYKQVQLDFDKICGWVVILLENYCQSTFLLLNKGKTLPAKALLRVISDVCIKCQWCLKGLKKSEEEFTKRFDKWSRSSLSEYKASLERNLNIFKREYGDEHSKLKKEITKRISEIKALNIKKDRLLITDELVSETWDKQSALNVEALYRRFHEAIHPDIVLMQKMLEESNGRIIYKADTEESPKRLKIFCLIVLGYLFETIYSLNKWDFSEFEKDIKQITEYTKNTNKNFMKFYKYHALGNDYLVLDPAEFKELTEDQIRRLCHRNYGLGSDGILYGPTDTEKADFALQIFNPDASEAEKSGNGLRIFARYLWDKGKVSEDKFTILTAGGKVKAKVHDNGKKVTVDMGQVSFDSTKIPVIGAPREVMNEEMEIAGKTIKFSAATIGNPHCVILQDEISEAEAKELGPLIETEPRFPNRTNVQFMKVLDRSNTKIEIWERGAGYTLASGSSSSAAAAVAHRLGLCDSNITVHMPGGEIEIVISKDYSITITGPVTKVAEGIIFEEIFI